MKRFELRKESALRKKRFMTIIITRCQQYALLRGVHSGLHRSLNDELLEDEDGDGRDVEYGRLLLTLASMLLSTYE